MLQKGDEIDIWVVEKALGQGGMGSVYRCHNRSAQRILAAVKVLDASLNRVASAKARFVREAEILFALDHPNIVKVRNVRMDAELPYLEMEFVQGRSLEDVVLRGATPMTQALDLMRQGLEALHYLHSRGIRHRDIKPSNLLVQDDGLLKLVDFGIATEQEAVTITESGQNFGSVSYAPPEWVEPDGLDPVRWDIYGLGVTFFELLTGRFAFPIGGLGTSRQKALQVMIAKQNHPPLDPGEEFPVALRAFVRQMTHSLVAERFATAEETLEAFKALDLEFVDREHDFGDVLPAQRTSATWYPGMEGSGETMVPAAGTMVPDSLEDFSDQLREAVPVESPAPAHEWPIVIEQRIVPDSLLEDEPSVHPKRRGPAPLVAGVAVLLVMGLAAAALWPQPSEPEDEGPPPVTVTDLSVILTGLPAEVPVALRLDGEEGEREGATFNFEAAPGEHTLVAVVGEDCAEGTVWCGRTEQTVTLEGERQTETLELSPPSATSLVIKVPGTESAMVRVGDEVFEVVDGQVRLDDLLPGRHEVEVGAGSCAPEARGCWPECPKGCASELLSVELPWEGELEVEAALELKDAPAAPPIGAPPSTNDLGAAASAVTNAAFGQWLSKNPDWQREAALEAGKAEGSYLKGWDGATPPSGKEGQAAVNVSWAAANAYCAPRGGLASIDASPQTWSEGGANPWHEFRQADGKPAWRRSDGNASTAVRWAETGTFIGFRCKR